VVYDVNTESAAGRARLRKVAQVCQSYGQRVQKSVFECILNEAQYELLRHELREAMNESSDSIRIYRLREPHERYTWLAGMQPSFDIRKPLVT
jgi:CRISPR-associated protein Cas2